MAESEGIARTNTVQTPIAMDTKETNIDAVAADTRTNWGRVRPPTGGQQFVDQGIEEYMNSKMSGAAARRAAIDKRRAKIELNRDRSLEDSGRAEIRRLREARQGFSARGTGRSGFEAVALGEISGDAERQRARMLEDLKEVFADLEKSRANSGGGPMSDYDRKQLALALEAEHDTNNKRQAPGGYPVL